MSLINRRPIEREYLPTVVEPSRIYEVALAFRQWVGMAKTRRTLEPHELALETAVEDFIATSDQMRRAS